MTGYKKYSVKEQKEIARIVDECGGNIITATDTLHKAGNGIHKSTVRTLWHKWGDRHIIDQRSGRGGKHGYSEDQRRAALKIYEACKFVYSDAVKVIKKDLGFSPKWVTLKSWVKLYGRDVCDTNRFSDVTVEQNKILARKFEAASTSVMKLQFDVKKAALERLADLIPKEKDINKLANVVKILQDAQIGDDSDKPMSLIVHYNNILKQYNEKQKDRDSGDIQDATIVNE